MPTYATAAQAQSAVPGLVIDDAAGFDALLEAAEVDIDSLLGPWPARADTGLKLSPPSDLSTISATILSRAVAFQAEYILAQGGLQAFVAPAPVHVKGPDFEVWHGAEGGRPRFAPRALAELSRIRGRLVPTGARARA